MYTYKYTFSSFYSSSSSFVLLFLGRPFYEPSQGQTDALKLSRHRTGNIQQTTDEYIHSTTSRVFHHQHTPVLDDAEKDGIVCVHANENFPLKKQREGGDTTRHQSCSRVNHASLHSTKKTKHKFRPYYSELGLLKFRSNWSYTTATLLIQIQQRAAVQSGSSYDNADGRI